MLFTQMCVWKGGHGSRTATITGTLFHDFDRLRVDLSVGTNHFHRSFSCLDGGAALVST